MFVTCKFKMRGQSLLQQSPQKTNEYVGSMELPVEGRPRHELYHARSAECRYSAR